MAAPVTITFLGGLGQIGRNCAAIETEGRIVVLDCGQMFGGDDLPGVDAVLPDLSYLIENADRVDAVIATHAHEDHIGALPYLLTHLSLPIYGSPFTLGMIDHKLRERGLQKNAELRPVHDGDRIDIGPFDCEFLPVTHSIPSGNITAFRTSQGVILHSSDFASARATPSSPACTATAMQSRTCFPTLKGTGSQAPFAARNRSRKPPCAVHETKLAARTAASVSLSALCSSAPTVL